MDYQKSATWERSFGTREGDAHRDPRARLRSGFEQFRSHVEPVASEIALSVPGYTDHSIRHCDALWDITDLLLTKDFPLNPAEAFVLGGAFLVHDLGMGLAAYAEGLPGILRDESWLDHLAATFPGHFEALNDAALRDVAADPTWNGITSPRIKEALTVYLREHHAEQAERVVSQGWVLGSGQTFYLLADTELRHWYGELIGKVARSHWLSVDQVREQFSAVRGAPPGFPPEWTVDATKVACILRVADAAHIDARRADPLHTPFRQPQGVSQAHWAFQEKMLHPRLHKDRLVYTSASPFSKDQAASWWLGFDTVRMIDDELGKVDALLADSGREQLVARAVLGADSASRFSEFVKTDGWTPVDARPTISNTEGVISNLGGTALYGRSNSIVIRELLANAVDATRLRRKTYGDDGIRPIRVSLFEEEGSDYLEIHDRGIGMDVDDIVSYLCDFGSSGWRSKTVQSTHPGALASGFQSTGQYGIGFYSSFMVANEVTVTTRPFHSGPADTNILEFNNGLHERPLLRKAERKEVLYEPGTRVRLRLRFPVQEELLSNSTRAQVRAEFAEIVRHQALLSDEKIEVLSLGATEALEVVGSSGWRSLSKEELFGVLKPRGSGRLRRIESDSGSAYRDHFLKFAAPLFSDDGTVQGVLALDFVEAKQKDRWSPSPIGAMYCGGFYAETLPHVMGVITGTPERASRDRAVPSVSRGEFTRWLKSQFDLAAELDIASADKLIMNELAMAAGFEDARFPIGITGDGYIGSPRYREWAAARDLITVIEAPSIVVDTPDGPVFYDHLAERMFKVPDSAIVVSYSGDWGPLDRMLMDFEEADLEILDLLEIASERLDWDVAEWWLVGSRSPAGFAIKCAADAWGVSVVDLLRGSKEVGRALGAENYVGRDAYTGEYARMFIDGIVIAKPSS